jgi:hypothetical protein
MPLKMHQRITAKRSWVMMNQISMTAITATMILWPQRHFTVTHCSGIIAAARNNKKGVDGIADNVRIMMIRAVPDGDEHDKDIANAIRYAVDNGAKIVSMTVSEKIFLLKSNG